MTIGGTAITLNNSGTSTPVTNQLAAGNYGAIVVTTKLTDARGLTKTITHTGSKVYQYVSPVLSS